MDGQVYNLSKSTPCLYINDSMIKLFQDVRTSSIVSTVLLVPSLILQLFFIYRYKSTFLHRQFLYTTVIVLLFDIISMVYTSTVDVGCHFFPLLVNSLIGYITDVEILQITTIHLLLLYKLCKHIETRTTQRLQALCCNIRPRLWPHDVIIVCFQLGLPLPIFIADIVVKLKTISIDFIYEVEDYIYSIEKSLLAVNALMGLICIVLLMLWFCMLWKTRLLKNKVKFVCTEMGQILLVLVVLLIGSILLLPSNYSYGLAVTSVMRIFLPVSFGVYILMSIPSLQKKVTTKAQVPATNRHTNPPSTRVSLPTDKAKHAPNFLSPSTAGPSEVTPLTNN